MSKKAMALKLHGFVTELVKERRSARGVSILVLAYIDTLLEKALLAALVDAPSVRALFDGSQRPLGSSSGRIDLTFALGLISEHMHRDLHLVRKIRNHFAHEIVEGSFDAEPVRSFMRQMSMFPFAEAMMPLASKPVSGVRQFDAMCAMVIGFLEAELRMTRRRRPKPPRHKPFPVPTADDLQQMRERKAGRRRRRSET